MSFYKENPPSTGIKIALDMIKYFLNGTIEKGVIRIPPLDKDYKSYSNAEKAAWDAVDYLTEEWDYALEKD